MYEVRDVAAAPLPRLARYCTAGAGVGISAFELVSGGLRRLQPVACVQHLACRGGVATACRGAQGEPVAYRLRCV